MTNHSYILQITSQLVRINRSFYTIGHHLTVGDNGLARLETEYVMTLITELADMMSNLENIGRQPEERTFLKDTRTCFDRILVTL